MPTVILIQAFNKAGQPQFRGKNNIPNHSDWIVLDRISQASRFSRSLTATVQATAEVNAALSQASINGTRFDTVVLKFFDTNGKIPYVPVAQIAFGDVVFDFSVAREDGSPNPRGIVGISFGNYTVVFSHPDLPPKNRPSDWDNIGQPHWPAPPNSLPSDWDHIGQSLGNAPPPS